MYKKNKGVNHSSRLLSATNPIKPMPTRAKVVSSGTMVAGPPHNIFLRNGKGVFSLRVLDVFVNSLG